MIEAKQTYCGQRVRYGDFFHVWDVHTDLPEEDAIKWCFEHLYNNRVVPPIQEWKATTRPGNLRAALNSLSASRMRTDGG